MPLPFRFALCSFFLLMGVFHTLRGRFPREAAPLFLGSFAVGRFYRRVRGRSTLPRSIRANSPASMAGTPSTIT